MLPLAKGMEDLAVSKGIRPGETRDATDPVTPVFKNALRFIDELLKPVIPFQ